jgi:hypothetical protein
MSFSGSQEARRDFAKNMKNYRQLNLDALNKIKEKFNISPLSEAFNFSISIDYKINNIEFFLIKCKTEKWVGACKTILLATEEYDDPVQAFESMLLLINNELKMTSNNIENILGKK